jgi:hypothetical protein
LKILILSDIHANWEALEKIDTKFSKRELEESDKALGTLASYIYDDIWFLGDVFDRGPDPDKTLEWLNMHVPVNNWVLGNHDAYFLDTENQIDMMGVDPRVEGEIEAQRRMVDETGVDLTRLKRAHRQYIKKRIKPFVCLLAHGSLRDPLGLRMYIKLWSGSITFKEELEIFQRENGVSGSILLGFLGHTHVPYLIALNHDNAGKVVKNKIYPSISKVQESVTYSLSSSKYWLINPGSIGSPRDGDNRASCAMLDTDNNEITFFRIEYDILKTMEKILRNEDVNNEWATQIMDATPPIELGRYLGKDSEYLAMSN